MTQSKDREELYRRLSNLANWQMKRPIRPLKVASRISPADIECQLAEAEARDTDAPPT